MDRLENTSLRYTACRRYGQRCGRMMNHNLKSLGKHIGITMLWKWGLKGGTADETTRWQSSRHIQLIGIQFSFVDHTYYCQAMQCQVSTMLRRDLTRSRRRQGSKTRCRVLALERSEAVKQAAERSAKVYCYPSPPRIGEVTKARGSLRAG